jgi:short-subunit dehydrogenase
MNNMPTALITGATSGIGAEYARRLAADGYNLIITGRRETKIKTFADNLSQTYNCNAEVFLVEFSDSMQLDNFIARIKDQDIHLLVNNAGFGTTKFFHEEPIKLQEEMVATHILAPSKSFTPFYQG